MDNQNLNLILAIVLSIGIIIGWQYFVEKPKLASDVVKHKQYNKQIKNIKKSEDQIIIDRDQAIEKSDRINFENEFVKGSINKVGLRLDDLTFKKYKETTDEDSDNVKLLSPNKTKDAYFVESSWISNSQIETPNFASKWKCSGDTLDQGKSINCHWKNNTNQIFTAKIGLDDKYMFNLKLGVMNNGSDSISLKNYGIIYKTYDFESSRMSVVHEGVSGVFNDELKEFSYKDIKDKAKQEEKISKINWLGISDKYWLVSFIPDNSIQYKSKIQYLIKNRLDRYRVDFISPSQILEPGASISLDHNIFGGAKELHILDEYEEKLNIPLFDRTVDFGWFYIITRPLLKLLHMIYGYVGNFGISIMLITILVKLVLFQLANKSYKSMKIMKELQPQIETLKENCGDDKVRFNQEVMNLYKNRNVNPLSGCLPLFIQIPVFFSLYKVLNVSIDMRHAPFYGWIDDLSVKDPTNLFTLFGLIPIDLPSFLHIGIWPMLMAGTMFLQQRMSPPMSDPVQAQMMRMLPFIFLFMFSGFPAGLLIYWTWNNILSIAQQSYINHVNK